MKEEDLGIQGKREHEKKNKLLVTEETLVKQKIHNHGARRPEAARKYHEKQKVKEKAKAVIR